MRQRKTKLRKIGHLLFLPPFLIALFICSAAWAQTGHKSASIPSLEEERIISLNRSYVNKRDTKIYAELNRYMVHYLRDGCKEKIQGDWAFVPQGDVINIMYDDKYQVFLGRVKSIVELDRDVVKPGYLLFKVYFPKEVTFFNFSPDRPMTLGELRGARVCFWSFEGAEYSYKVQAGTKIKTQGPIKLTPVDQIGHTFGNQLMYQADKSSYELRRVIRK